MDEPKICRLAHGNLEDKMWRKKTAPHWGSSGFILKNGDMILIPRGREESGENTHAGLIYTAVGGSPIGLKEKLEGGGGDPDHDEIDDVLRHYLLDCDSIQFRTRFIDSSSDWVENGATRGALVVQIVSEPTVKQKERLRQFLRPEHHTELLMIRDAEPECELKSYDAKPMDLQKFYSKCLSG